MSNTMRYFEHVKSAVLTSVNTAMPCKVLAYNEADRTAKIQPLFKAKEVGKEPKNLPPIEGVPVLFQRYKAQNNGPISIKTDTAPHSQYSGSGEHIHNVITFTEAIEMIPDLRVGDVVLVVFCQRAIDEAQNGKNVYPGISRMFSIQDAVIVGVF